MEMASKSMSEARNVFDELNLVFTDGHIIALNEKQEAEFRAYSLTKQLEARIDTATDILYGFSRTYKQEVTDNEGNVYASDSHDYIPKYEVQEYVAELQHQLSKE